MMKSLLIVLALFGGFANADEIEFPEEELARETTLPVFEKRRVVLNRNVVTEGRFELGIGGGLEANEPYYNDYMAEVQATYNFTDVSALNIQALMWMDGLSNYGEQLKAGGKHAPFDAERAPHPKMGIFANYQFVAYYGKISLTKQGVMNLNLFGLAGLGYLNLDSDSTIALNLGVGQNFFFTKHVGMRFDLRQIIYQGPNPASAGTNMRPTDVGTPSFEDRIFYNTQLGLALVYVM